MYRVTCDGFPLLDLRDDDLVLANPKLRLAVNTVCEGSFTIYKNHPYYEKLKLLKSVVEVSDEYGVIFRGRATGDTVDINNGMTVDLEGALSYFNDSVVRPFAFPDDFEDDASYQTAAGSGNVVAFFLDWLIDNHNAQVQPFQRLHLGNVTVSAANNQLKRVDNEYSSTWETMKTSLFNSELGGYLCIRYEPDGNYVDYLSGFESTNEQQIVFGENLLDIINEWNATETYTAIVPLGSVIEYKVQTGVVEGDFVDFINTKKIKENVNIKSIADGDVTDDLVKSGDTIYSKSGVAKYGWIYAPTNETTWNYVEDAGTLMTAAVDWLQNRSVMNHSIEVTAVDLHCTDAQIRSLRMYQNIIVYSEPHDLSEKFQISMLEIDLLNPQKTNITIGETCSTLTDRNVTQTEDFKNKYTSVEKESDNIRQEIMDELAGLTASIDVALGGIHLEVGGLADEYTRLSVTLDGVTVTDPSGTTRIKGSSIETDSLVLTGKITWDDLDSTTQNTINSAGGISSSQAKSIASTVITETLIASPKIVGAEIHGGEFYGSVFKVINDASSTGGLQIYGMYEDSLWNMLQLSYAPGDQYHYAPYVDIYSPAGASIRFNYEVHGGEAVFYGTTIFDSDSCVDFTGATVTGLSVVFG